MRQIRIRALDVNKKLFKDNYFIKCNGMLGNVTYVKLDMEKVKYREIEEDVLFLLNTGIKDKKGVEGFYKDIVRDPRGDYYTIEWDDQFATFIMKDKNENHLPICCLKYSEIIGNSFMDPVII